MRKDSTTANDDISVMRARRRRRDLNLYLNDSTEPITTTTTVEQPELAVQPAVVPSTSQTSTSGLKNLYGQAMKGVGAVTSLASPWSAITTMSKLLPTSISSEIERGQQRFINSALLGLPQQAEKKITGQTPEYAQTRSWKEDKLGSALDFASTTAGYFIPGLGWIKGLSTTGRLGKLLLAGKVPQLAKGATTGQKIARTAKVAGQQAKEGAIAGAGLMGAEVGIREALNPQDYTAGQNALDILLGAGQGLAIDPLAYGAIKGVGRLFGRGQPTAPPVETTKPPVELVDPSKSLMVLPPRSGNVNRAVSPSVINQPQSNALMVVPQPTRVRGNVNQAVTPDVVQPPLTPAVIADTFGLPAGNVLPATATPTYRQISQILEDIAPEVNRRLDPPLTNKTQLSQWLKKYVFPDESLSKIQKRPAEELRQIATDARKNLDTREMAIEVAKEKNINLDELFKKVDTERGLGGREIRPMAELGSTPKITGRVPTVSQASLDNIITPPARPQAEAPPVRAEEQAPPASPKVTEAQKQKNIEILKKEYDILFPKTPTPETPKGFLDNIFRKTAKPRSIDELNNLRMQAGKELGQMFDAYDESLAKGLNRNRPNLPERISQEEQNRLMSYILSKKGITEDELKTLGLDKRSLDERYAPETVAPGQKTMQELRDGWTEAQSQTSGKSTSVVKYAIEKLNWTKDDLVKFGYDEQSANSLIKRFETPEQKTKREIETTLNNIPDDSFDAAEQAALERLKNKGTKYSLADDQPPAERSFKDVNQRTPEITAAANDLIEGKITRKEFEKVVNEKKPVTEYTSIPVPASIDDLNRGLSTDKLPRIGIPSSTLADGEKVGLRLDIPAYSRHGVWVVSVHEPAKSLTSGMAGRSIGYESVAAIKNVRFKINENVGINISSGKTPKTTIATMEGNWSKVSPEEAYQRANSYLKDDQWTQVGMDPERHGYFYTRGKGNKPVISADEVLQIGGLVFAKNVKTGKKSKFLYALADSMRSSPKTKVSEALNAAEQSFGNATKKLIQMGKIKVVDKVSDLPAGNHPSNAKAVAFPDGTTYYVASNLTPNEMPGLVLHEVGVHVGMKNMVGEQFYNNLLEQVRTNPDQVFQQARQFASKYAKDQQAEEALAYLIQNAPKSNIARTILSQIKNWFAKTFPNANIKLSEADFRQLAISALKKVARDSKLKTDKISYSLGKLSNDDINDYATIMISRLKKGTAKLSTFEDDLVNAFGQNLRPYANQILQQTSQIIKLQAKNLPASQQIPSPTTVKTSQNLQNKGSVNVVSNLVNNTNNTTPAAITPIQYNKLNSFDKHTRDVYRNLQHALGQQAADKYLNMLDDAKKENLDMQQFWLKWLEDEVIKKYNIKRGSKSSKLVQMFGEQKITLAELQQRAPKNWQNIVNADKAFRFAYDKLIDEVNATRLQIHGLDVRIKDINQDPNLTAAEKKQQVDDIVNQATNEGKLIPKRTNYYRHFKDNGALYSYKNIYDTVSKIGDLTEEFRNMTNSKILTSFVSFAKKRMGNKTKYDAVAGFLDYIPAASYAVKIDPMIKPFRELGDFIRQDAQTRNIDVGDLADYLNEFADDLANVRQSELDKSVSGIESFKLTLSAAHLITNMVKRNLLVGNLGTVLVQGSNLANAFGYTKQYAVVGIGRTLNEIFNKSARLSNQSTYLRERGFAKEYRRLDDRILMQPLNFANWLMETADMTTAKIIWNSAYAQGKAKKVADPMRYADDIARKSTAGRGVGEMPFINKGKLFNIVAPFQYDVANTLQVYRDIGITKKDVMGLASLMIAAYVSNEILKAIRGSGGQLDLINAFIEASKKDLTPVQRGGRVLGELLSNIPLMQTVAAFDGVFPKYGGERDILGFKVDMPSREKLFGSADPTRFGEDLLLFNALKQPQYFVLPPFGGAQIRKTQEAITALAKGKSEEDKQTRFLLDNSNAWRNLNTALFGIYTSPEGRRYLKEDQRMLSVEQSKMLDSLPKRQQKLTFEELQTTRKLNTIKSKAIDVAKDEKLTQTEKDRKIKSLEEEYLKLAKNFETFMAEQNKK